MGKPLAALVAAAFAVVAPAMGLPARAEVPKVVASIQPLHSLIASVMQGVGEPALVVGGSQSEHTYALKPSDARTLQAARLVVLVDESYETFLAKPLKARADGVEVVALARLPGAVRLPTREGGTWEPDHDGHDEHGHGALDGHLWLDTGNARLLVAAVAERLSALDAEHAATYRANAAATLARLDALEAQMKARLEPVASRPFVVFHDAYQYLEKHYGLAAAGAITVDPDRPPSARRLAALRDRLRTAGAACVFREP
ncbi:MAG TPA: zinc ABC transporter substrate-binding protein, partial [Magnetospirillum sp.]|nr:zinc ABC transporter substrate-binding protein [Magnetospirillum sp.]